MNKYEILEIKQNFTLIEGYSMKYQNFQAQSKYYDDSKKILNFEFIWG